MRAHEPDRAVHRARIPAGVPEAARDEDEHPGVVADRRFGKLLEACQELEGVERLLHLRWGGSEHGRRFLAVSLCEQQIQCKPHLASLAVVVGGRAHRCPFRRSEGCQVVAHRAWKTPPKAPYGSEGDARPLPVLEQLKLAGHGFQQLSIDERKASNLGQANWRRPDPSIDVRSLR
jgi:hypothetical protein